MDVTRADPDLQLGVGQIT